MRVRAGGFLLPATAAIRWRMSANSQTPKFLQPKPPRFESGSPKFAIGAKVRKPPVSTRSTRKFPDALQTHVQARATRDTQLTLALGIRRRAWQKGLLASSSTWGLFRPAGSSA